MRVRTEDENNNFTLLRLLLALAVVLGHFKLLSGTARPTFPFNFADAAVDSFFVVSGYLITLSYDRARGLGAFYVRRFFRLYPMYVCIVLLQTAIMLTLLPGGVFSEPEQMLHYLAANLVFANFLQYDIGRVLSGLAVPGINPSLWTLKIELSFYLIVPLIWAAFRRWGFKSLFIIFVASVAYEVIAMRFGDLRYAKQLPGQLQFFVVGMALYIYVRNIQISVRVSAIVTALFLLTWTWMDPILPGICPLVVGAFVFCVALRTPVVRMRTDMSYSVYLVHGPLIQTLLLFGLFRDTPLMLVGIVVAVPALSWATEYLVERPGNELGRRLSKRLGRHPATVMARVA